jgi:hypothetical protein
MPVALGLKAAGGRVPVDGGDRAARQHVGAVADAGRARIDRSHREAERLGPGQAGDTGLVTAC